MDYRTWEPNEELRSIIKCYWVLKSPAEDHPQKQRIVPDGCMEMIFHCGDLYKQYLDDDRSIIQPRSFVFGQISGNLDIEPTGVTDIFAVRFLPDGFNPLAAIPIKDMENRAVALDELFGDSGTDIERQIINADSTEQRIDLVEAFILKLLVSPRVMDKMVRATVESILQINGKLTVGELSGQLNVNRRQLERRFASVVGLSPKQMSKIIRLQAALNMLIGNRFTSFTALAHEGDYYDQAHFIKDFKEFTGVSPGRFFADNMKMSVLFYGQD